MYRPWFLAVAAAALYLLFPSLLAAQYISEFMASNVTAHRNATGDFVDWIEIYNPGDAPVDLAGYYLTDAYEQGELWQVPSGHAERTTVPARGYLLLYANGQPELGPEHLGFKLSREGEEIVLVARDGETLVDRVEYGAQRRDISHGRAPTDHSRWLYFDRATPGEKNEGGYATFAQPPSIALESGFYPEGVEVVITGQNSGDTTVRYTLDGAEPTSASMRYGEPLQIDRHTVLKARSFAPGALASETATRVFFVGADHALPVFSLAVDTGDLSDPGRGILVNDESGREWERFAEMALFVENELAFSAPTGLRVQGNSGPKQYEKKSFRVFLRGGYGRDEVEYPLFAHAEGEAFARLVLRSGYDDSLEPTENRNTRATLLRDPLVGELWRQAGGLTSQSRFGVLYLNGAYNGIYDLRQNVDATLVRDRWGYGDLDLVRARWDSVEVVEGDRAAWDETMRFFRENELVEDEKLAEAAQLLDLEDFTNLQALVHATEYVSWGYGVFMFRERAPDATWKWVPWDGDRAYNDINWNSFTTPVNPLNRDLDSLITQKLLRNRLYRDFYINRFADLFNTVFSSSNVLGVLDSLAAEIEPEIPAEVALWGNTVRTWNENMRFVRDFAVRRPPIVSRQMQEFFELRGTAELRLDTQGSGRVRLNSIVPSAYPWAGQYYQGVPVEVEAIADEGHRFVGWSDPTLPAQEIVQLDLSGDRELVALFAEERDTQVELVAPRRVVPGQRLPFAVRLRGAGGEIDPLEQTPVALSFGAARADTSIQIKRGAGTGTVLIDEGDNFVLVAGNEKVQGASRLVEVSTRPIREHAGELPIGETVWDASADHLVVGDIAVPEGAHLIVEQDTWVLVKKFVNFFVRGKVSVRGSAEAPVVLISAQWEEPWGGMEFHNAQADFSYCMVLNGGGDDTRGFWHTGRQHIFYGENFSDFSFDQCFFLYAPGKVFGASNSRVNISNSITAFVWHGGEFIRTLLDYRDSHFMNLPNDDHVYVEDIDTDALHIDHINLQYPQFSTIDNCYFVTGKDDAIDHHNARLAVSNCWIEDFVHEGVAASGGDTLRIFNTLAIGNEQGFEAGYTDTDGGPYVFIDHSVAVGNEIGLRIGDGYNWDQWTYQDRVVLTNSVLYDNGDNIRNYVNTLQDSLPGALHISHSMTNDTDYDASPFSIRGVPRFDERYYLLPDSPGAGMAMGARSMGRAKTVSALRADSLIINEIMYTGEAGDWIELYNGHGIARDLSGWSLKDDDDSHVFVFAPGTVVAANAYWVVCRDTLAFATVHPQVRAVSGELSFGYGGSDAVRLYDELGQLVDGVLYTDELPWPESAEGYSIELLSADRDNAAAESWSLSTALGGSPGRPNRMEATDIAETSAVQPLHFALGQNYPNPFNGETAIEFVLPDASAPLDVKLEIFDVLGQRVKTLVAGALQGGPHRVRWDGRSDSGVPLASGLYFYRLQTREQVQTRKVVLLR